MAFHVVDGSGPKKPLKINSKRPFKKPMNKWLKRLWIVVAILTLGIGSVSGYVLINHHQIEQQVSANQKADSKTKHHASTHAEKLANKDISFDQNGDIPDAKTLQSYRNLPEKLSFDGYIAVPKQNGVSTPIKTLQINEGASNKVLAYGAGTIKPNQVMGQGTYGLAAHNVGYGGGSLMFSPMQKGIDVNQEPKAYLSNGKNILVYQFYKESDSVKGRQVISYKGGGKVADDVTNGEDPRLVLATCDEPGAWNSHPENRIIMTAHLIKAVSFNGATDFEKSLFPAFNR